MRLWSTGSTQRDDVLNRFNIWSNQRFERWCFCPWIMWRKLPGIAHTIKKLYSTHRYLPTYVHYILYFENVHFLWSDMWFLSSSINRNPIVKYGTVTVRILFSKITFTEHTRIQGCIIYVCIHIYVHVWTLCFLDRKRACLF